MRWKKERTIKHRFMKPKHVFHRFPLGPNRSFVPRKDSHTNSSGRLLNDNDMGTHVPHFPSGLPGRSLIKGNWPYFLRSLSLFLISMFFTGHTVPSIPCKLTILFFTIHDCEGFRVRVDSMQRAKRKNDTRVNIGRLFGGKWESHDRHHVTSAVRSF